MYFLMAAQRVADYISQLSFTIWSGLAQQAAPHSHSLTLLRWDGGENQKGKSVRTHGLTKSFLGKAKKGLVTCSPQYLLPSQEQFFVPNIASSPAVKLDFKVVQS